MCHSFLGTANYWALLLRIDEDLLAEARAGRCPRPDCDGVLHRADYPRKPRGIELGVLGEEYSWRFSLCCNREGCRGRCTPASVRFLGPRVYLGAVVVLATALSPGLTPRRVARLHRCFGVSVRTLRRWRTWWHKEFAASALWLPAALLKRLSAGIWARACASCCG